MQTFPSSRGFLRLIRLLTRDIERPPSAEVDAGTIGAHDEEA